MRQKLLIVDAEPGIYEAVWGLEGDGSSDVVMEHIRKIRAKLGLHTLHGYIETVWGCGYKWNG